MTQTVGEEEREQAGKEVGDGLERQDGDRDHVGSWRNATCKLVQVASYSIRFASLYNAATIAPNPITRPALPIHALAVSAAPAVLSVVLGDGVPLIDVPLPKAPVAPAEAVDPFVAGD